MRHAYTPPSHRRTPTKLLGGGKETPRGTHWIALLEGTERSSSRALEDSNMLLLSSPLSSFFSPHDIPFSPPFRPLSLSVCLSLSCTSSYYAWISPTSLLLSVPRRTVAYFSSCGSFSFARRLSAFEPRVHLYSAPTLLLFLLLLPLAILLHAGLHECIFRRHRSYRYRAHAVGASRNHSCIPERFMQIYWINLRFSISQCFLQDPCASAII